MLGLDGWRYLTGDLAERIALLGMVPKVEELREIERQNLAVEIVNALARAMKK